MSRKIKNKDFFSWIYLVLPVVLLIIIVVQSNFYSSKEITQDDFFEKLKNGEIEKITIYQKERVNAILKKKSDKISNSNKMVYNFEYY